ncbi:hypothetical protein HJC23_011261 [Cyclotella cryptica]|uniref:WW domain-containing protein n=1 Tax=Cyclotella cryptica TaxID=29204 RepID=A0ABD3QV55_9STRA
MNHLFVAITLDQTEVVRNILTQHLVDINQIDEQTGDQAAHLAARLNRVECMKLLIEYDGRMGRKNFNGLTPLGEAQMNGHTEIVALIKDNYSTNECHEYIWYEEINRECAAWYDFLDERQVLQWARKGPTGCQEVSATPPPIDSQRIIKAREKYGERNVVRRLHPGSLLSQQQLAFDRQKETEKKMLSDLLKSRAAIVEERCATKLQAHFRKMKATNLARQQRIETAAARCIQSRFRFFLGRKKNQSAVKIQSFLRMRFASYYFKFILWERLWWHRASRILALIAQRLWRGFTGRAYFRRLHEMRNLPNPNDIRNHDFWEQLQNEAHPPTKELGVYAEYTLGGTPRTWAERNYEKRNGMYRDVVFYANVVTRRAMWTKPNGWLFRDHREYYVLRLQTFWRARVAKRKIRLLVKAKILLENAYSKDLENTKQDITSLCNFALYTHVVLHDYDTARMSYVKILSFMNERGVDNAFVLYSYAIFVAVTNEEDWDDINDNVRRAKTAEERMRKRRQVNCAGYQTEPKSLYAIAREAFYLQAVSNDSDSGESWHNYALCQMLVYRDLQGARESFRRAIMASPTDRRIISNFNALLQNSAYLGLLTNAHDEYLKLTEA